MGRYITRILTIAVAACAVLSVEADARRTWVYWGPLNWEIELEYEGRNEKRDVGKESRSVRYSERLELKQSGYFISPRLFDYSLILQPTFKQRQKNYLRQEEQIQEVNFDYDVNLEVLRDIKFPISFGAGASRGTGTVSSNLDYHADFTNESRFARMQLTSRAFPMVLSYREKLHKQSSGYGSLAIPRFRDEFQKSVRWTGQSSKLQVLVEKVWFDDQIGDNDYEMLQQTLSHTFRWGKNSSLATNHSFRSRDGKYSVEQRRSSERLHIQHLDNLGSSLVYRYSKITHEDDTEIQHGNYTLKYTPSENLDVSLIAEGQNSQFQLGSELSYFGKVDLKYTRDISRTKKLNIGLGGFSKVTERRSGGATFETLDSSHTIPITLLVLLGTRAIDTGSILVTDSTSSQVFLDGVDYIVETLTGGRTELQILTSGLIGVGDTILVSYRAAVEPSAEYKTEAVNADVSLDFDWGRFYHRTSITNLTLQSGLFGEGQHDRRDQTTGVEFVWSRAWLMATIGAERNSHESGDFSTKTRALMETFRIDISASTNLVLTANQLSYSSDGIQTDVSQWNANLGWKHRSGIVINSYVSELNRVHDEGRFEDRLTAGAKLTWRLRKFKLTLDLSHREVVSQDRDWSDQRAFMRVVRRSR